MKKVTFLSILVMMFLVIGFGPPKDVDASTTADTFKAWSWGDVSTFITNKVESGSYAKYKAKFREKKSNLYVKGKSDPIDLSATVKVNGKNTGIYKYYFWIDDNKQRVNSWHWSTEYFMVTEGTIGSDKNPSTYNCSGGKKADRLEATKTQGEDSFLKSLGDEVSNYALDFYVVDMTDWIKSVWNEDSYDEVCYIQPVTRTYDGDSPKHYMSGTATFNYSMRAWMDATPGWGCCSYTEYVSHYNYKVHIKGETQSTVKVHYKVWETGDGYDTDSIKRLSNLPGTSKQTAEDSAKTLKSNEAFTLDKLSPDAITGKGYYLKGIKVVAGDKEEHFYVLNDYDSSPQIVLNPKSETITKYSKPNGTGKEKDTFAGDVMKAAQVRKFAAANANENSIGLFRATDDKGKVLETESNTNSDGTARTKTNDAKGAKAKANSSGNLSYTKAVAYMESLYHKKHGLDEDIYLIYQEVGSTDDVVNITQNVWEWNDSANEGAGGYEIVSTTTSTKRTLVYTLNSEKQTAWSVAESRLKDFNKTNVKKSKYAYPLHDVQYEITGGNPKFTGQTSIHLYNSSGNDANSGTGSISKLEGDATVWNGNNDSRGIQFESNTGDSGADLLLKHKVVVPLMDSSSNDYVKTKLNVTLNYYQPKTIYTSAMYFQHKVDGEFSYSYVHELNQKDTSGRKLGHVQVSSTKSGSTNYGGTDSGCGDCNKGLTVSQPDSSYVFRARDKKSYFARVPAYVIQKSQVKQYLVDQDNATNDNDKNGKGDKYKNDTDNVTKSDITVEVVKAAIVATETKNGTTTRKYSKQMTSDENLTILEDCGFSKVVLKDDDSDPITFNTDDTSFKDLDGTSHANDNTNWYVQYYAVDFQTLAYKIYGDSIKSVDNKSNKVNDEKNNMGEYFQLGDVSESTTAEKIYKAFVDDNAFSDVKKDDNGNTVKVQNHRICYEKTSEMSDEFLKYMWKVKKTDSYVADAKASNWQGYSDEKKDSWTKKQQNKKKKLPSSNGGTIKSGDTTTFATTKIKKVALATSIYKVDEPEPHITVNLKIGIGTAALKDVSTDNVQWLDYTYQDEDVDNSTEKQTFEYKVYSDLAKMVPNAKLGLSDNEDYVLLAGLTTEEWTSGTEENGKYNTEKYSKGSTGSSDMRDAHYVSGVLAYDSPLSRAKAICYTESVTNIGGRKANRGYYNSGLSGNSGQLYTAGLTADQTNSSTNIAVNQIVTHNYIGAQYISPYDSTTNAVDSRINYFTCRYRWDVLGSDGVNLTVANRSKLAAGQTCNDANDDNCKIVNDNYYTTVKNVGQNRTKDSVVITYYYYAQITTKTTSYPEVTTTPYTWDDIPKATATANPSGKTTTSVNGDDFGLQGKITATADPQVKGEDSNIVGNDTADSGGDGNITLPDGQIISGQYVANLLGLDAWSTSYLTAGSVTKHTVNVRYDVTVAQLAKIVASDDGRTLGLNVHKTVLSPSVRMVYYTLDYLKVWDSDTGKMYNYAFPSSSGKTTEDADTRTYDGKEYYVSLGKNASACKDGTIVGSTVTYNSGVDPGGCHWYGDDGDTSALDNVIAAPNIDVADATFNDEDKVTYFNVPAADTSTMASALSAVMDSIATTSNFWARSDTVTFTLPSWAQDPDIEESESSTAIEQRYDKASRTYTMMTGDMATVASTSQYMPSKINQGDYVTVNGYDLGTFKIPSAESCVDGTYQTSGIKISRNKLNTGDTMDGPSPDSRLEMTYKSTVAVGSNTKAADGIAANSFDVSTDNVNKITLHTPVALSVKMTKVGSDNYLQKVEKGTDGILDLTLGDAFKLTASYTGYFPVYASIDTEKYVKENCGYLVRCDFPVYEKKKDGTMTFHKKGKEFSVTDLENTVFYVANWAKEGTHNVDVTVQALNVLNTGSEGSTLLPKDDEKYRAAAANCIRDYYAATSTVYTNLSGKLFDLSITDISDYPTLEKVFRTTGYNRSLYTINSGTYSSSTRTNRADDDDTYPVVYGDELGNSSTDEVIYGPLKTGYKIRYLVNTIGSLTSSSDYVKITPTFQYVPKGKGVQDAVDVNLYYKEQINGTTKKLVKVGSDEDNLNIHQTCISDKEYGILPSVIATTAKLCGYTDTDSFATKVVNSWTYSDITLSNFSRIFVGSRNSVPLLTMNDGTSVTAPSSSEVGTGTLTKAHQQWYGEFYLPDEVHAIKTSDESKLTEDLKSGVDFTEDYWCEDDGYLIVNFQIEAYSSVGNAADDESGEVKKYLAYDASQYVSGNCNMWNLEQRVDKKTDSKGQTFEFKQGDFIMYDLGKSASDDYDSAGTH